MSKDMRSERKFYAMHKGISAAAKLSRYAPPHIQVEQLVRQGIPRYLAEDFVRRKKEDNHD